MQSVTLSRLNAGFRTFFCGLFFAILCYSQENPGIIQEQTATFEFDNEGLLTLQVVSVNDARVGIGT